MLTITAQENKVAIIHSISCLVVPPRYQHQNQNNILAFLNDADGPNGLLQIVKLEGKDFEGGMHWCHPDLMTIMNLDPNSLQVLLVTSENEMVITAKFIPIPLFLVPFFLDDETPKHALSMFHHFYDTFYEKSAPALQMQTKHIYDFLLAACGMEGPLETTEIPMSQLAVLMEELELDTVLMQWAMYQFGGMTHIAGLHDIAKGYNTMKYITKNCRGIDAEEGSHGTSTQETTFQHEGVTITRNKAASDKITHTPNCRGNDAEDGIHGNSMDEPTFPCKGV